MNLTPENLKDDDDLGVIYHGKCGHWHWKCFLCSPVKRSQGFSNDRWAAIDLSIHLSLNHNEDGLILVPHKG